MWQCWVPGRAGGTAGGVHLKNWVGAGPWWPRKGLEERKEVPSQQ